MWRATVPMPRLGDTSITFTQRPWGMGLPVGSLRKLVDVGRGGEGASYIRGGRKMRT